MSLPVDPPRVIGIWAPAPQSGKSTVAAHLAELDAMSDRINFADTLRSIVLRLLLDSGVNHAEAHRYIRDGAYKEVVIPEIGKSFVDLMIAFGTVAGRGAIGPDVWVNTWKHRVRQFLDLEATYVIADDVRFRNEAEAVRAVGGIMIGVVRPGATVSAARAAAEGHLTRHDMDVVVMNTGSIASLEWAAERALRARGVPLPRLEVVA